MSRSKPDRGEEKRVAKSAARLYAVQALFQMEAGGADVDRVIREFESHRFGAAQEDDVELPEGHVDLFRRVVTQAFNHQARIDQLTQQSLVAGWPIDRIDPTLRALFRAGGAELVATDTPARVVIAEYLDIADAFFPDGREKPFVNAVLDAMARVARPEAFA